MIRLKKSMPSYSALEIYLIGDGELLRALEWRSGRMKAAV